jgi:hypothetical protein
MESFRTADESLSLGFFIELALLCEYSALAGFFICKTVQLMRSSKSSGRALTLHLSLIFSAIVRIVLFIPISLPAANSFVVIDMFTASVSYFTAISALLSQWYDVYVLSRWCHKFEKKYMMIKRFTVTNVLMNVFLWTMFLGMIAVAESIEKGELMRYFVFRFLIYYDLFLNSLLMISIITIGWMLKVQLENLIDGNRIRFTNMIRLTFAFTLLRFFVAVFLFTSENIDVFRQSKTPWMIFYLVEFNLSEILSMIVVHKTSMITCKLFNVSISFSIKVSSAGASVLSVSNDFFKTDSLVK